MFSLTFCNCDQRRSFGETYQNTVISKTAKISADHSINKRQDNGPQNDNQQLYL